MPFAALPLANPLSRFCPSYQYFTGFDDAKEGLADDVCVVGEEATIELLQ